MYAAEVMDTSVLCVLLTLFEITLLTYLNSRR